MQTRQLTGYETLIGYSQYSLLLSVGAVLCDVVTPVQERATVFQSCPCARTRESGLHFRVFWRSRVFYIFRRSQCPGTRDLPSSGHGVSRESGSVAAAWIACLDSRYSVVDSRSVRHATQGVLAHIGLLLRMQCISRGKIGTIRSRKISKLVNSESNSKFEIRK